MGRLGEGLVLPRRFPLETLDAQLHARPRPLVPLLADKLLKLRQHPDVIAVRQDLRRLGSHVGGGITAGDLQEEITRRGVLGA